MPRQAGRPSPPVMMLPLTPTSIIGGDPGAGDPSGDPIGIISLHYFLSVCSLIIYE